MRNCLLLLIFCLPLHLLSQGTDTNVIVSLNDKALEIAYANPAYAMKLADRALSMSRKIGFKRGEVRALIRKGIVYDIQSKNEEAIEMYTQSLAIAEKSNDRKGAASNLNNLGLICYKLNRYTDAIKYFTRADAIFIELKDEENQGFVANNIGLLHMEMRQLKKALKSYRQSLNHYTKTSNKTAAFDVYSNIGSTFEFMGQLDSSLLYTEKAVEGFRKIGDKYSLGITLSNLGTLNFKQKRYPEAEENLVEAMKNSKEVGNTFSYVGSASSLASIYTKMGRQEEAYGLLQECYTLLPEIQSNELGYEVCYDLALLEIEKGNREAALKLLQEFRQYNEAYATETMKKNYAELEQRFSLKEEQRRSAEVIRDQNEKHFRETIYWASGLVLLILSSLLTFFIIRKRNLQKQLENQQAVFDATMEERKRISYDLHDHVGSQLSYVVNNLEMICHQDQDNERISRTFAMSQAAMGSLRDTVWALHTEELTIDILAQRMENVALKTLEQTSGIAFRMKNEISSETLISAQNTLHVMRIFQEAVHNIVKHAEASEVEVCLKETETNYMLTISDNGKGITSLENKPYHYGLQSMQDRASKINGVLIFDKPLQELGTIVLLRWPKNSSIA